ncbi:KilA-N domain-containing protein [Sulfurimonas sp. RIFOXYB12_FULL_35_9]|uniref:KilA-N domain-containing protein n=1 Tax=Sulfurimonas sp. RIFOXYB12_FULL_35_9 TaxID=1802256 RepID=UPI0008D4EEDE|nr:KilA-N domain-containing protein [Sulfurimonas sp. RIFOXYB12_FULL_35_9]OHE04604.1 MAG: DNA-binding protein [Sulfurimonas sp. RIFOXYB12_FULL_35_9]
MKNNKILVQNTEVSIKQHEKVDFISLTDIARAKNPDEPKDVVKNWLRSKTTIEFLGLWEYINNPFFKGVEFDSFKNEAGSNSFTMSPTRWIEKTSAIGIISKAGRYGGTYAHKDIAFEFASWISAEFKLFLIKEFQRLKEDEIQTKSLEWDLSRSLSKINYKIHTDAIKEHLLPRTINKPKESFIYANEADLLNVALFGMTSKEWREANKDKDGNVRDYASVEQLIVLSNLESINAELIKQDLPQNERLVKLNQTAIAQMKSLINNPTLKNLAGK